MEAFQSGPFAFEPVERARIINSQAGHSWSMRYAESEIAVQHIPEGTTQAQIIERFGEARGAFVRECRARHAPARFDLIDSRTGEPVAQFFASSWPSGLQAGLVDDRYLLWLRSADRKRAMPVTIDEYAALVAELAAPANNWIAGLLPEDVLTNDPESWRAPSSWEIRHAVGEGSFTGISGAKAAALVGVQPQGFRKYTARDDASSRQTISFAMWHLLLHKLGVQRA